MDAKDLIKTGLANSKRTVDKVLDGLTPEEVNWQPRPDANSISLILFHMARTEDRFLQPMIQQKPQVWEAGKWFERLGKDQKDTGSRYTADQVAGFRVPDFKDLQAYSAAVRQGTLDYVASLTPEQLDRQLELPPLPPPAPGTPPPRRPYEPIVGSLLMVNVTHLAQHAGEISYIRGLQRGMDK